MEYPWMCPARWLSDQNFPVCVPPHDFMYPFQDMQSNYYSPWKWYNQSISKEFGSTIENEKGNCKITLDVQHFRPNEINVKVTDYEIVVEGRHEERADMHGFVTRQFKRRYPLPNHCPSENVTSTLSSDGVLTIIAEKISSIHQKEKIVPIKICGTSPRKTLVETKTSSEITQKENIKDSDILDKKMSQKAFKGDHSRLLTPETLKETISATNGTCTKAVTKESIDYMKTSEKIDPFNISSTSNKIEESIGKTILGLAALTEQLGQNSSVSTSEMCRLNNALEMSATKSASENSEMSGNSGMKSAPQTSDTKSALQMTSMASASQTSDTQSALQMTGTTAKSSTKSTSEIPEISRIKTASEILGMKSTSESELSGKKIASDVCGVRDMAKTLIEESSSSYKSSSSILSTMRSSEKAGECISDIRRELREAAENV